MNSSNGYNVQITNNKYQYKMTDQELKDLVANLAIQSAKTDAQIAKTDAQIAKTNAEVKKIAKMYGSAANNHGDVAEEFFFNSLSSTLTLNNIKYDKILKNLHILEAGVEDEYDILMANGKDVFIIEVKYKAHQTDLDKILDRKYPNFKKLFPEYKNYNHHLGLASFHINDELKDNALLKGVSILQRKGNVIQTIAA